MSDESGHIMAVTPRRPLVPWRVAAGGGWAAAAAAWPVLGAAFALSGIAGVTLATVLLELSLTGGLLLGIFQLRRRGIPFRFRDQQGPTMTVLTGATLTCAVPALVWSTSEVLHNPAFPLLGGAFVLPIAWAWMSELRAWRRGQARRPLSPLVYEEIEMIGTIAFALIGLFIGIAGILNLVGVLHWEWLPK